MRLFLCDNDGTRNFDQDLEQGRDQKYDVTGTGTGTGIGTRFGPGPAWSGTGTGTGIGTRIMTKNGTRTCNKKKIHKKSLITVFLFEIAIVQYKIV